MPQIHEDSRTIEGTSADAVFAFVADIDNFPVWADAVVEARADGPLEVGRDITSVSSMMGLKIKGVQTVVEHDPPARFAYRGEDPFPVLFEWTFTQDGPSVTAALRCEITPIGLPGGGAVVGRFLRRQIAGMVGNVQARCSG
jgi:hypothetical protein